MRDRISLSVLALLAALAVPSTALASVGRVSLLVGKASRLTPKPAQVRHRLGVGSEIELLDHVVVESGSHLKVTLNDGSVIILGPGSDLEITEAGFAGQDRKGFSAKLWLGKIWSEVTKVLSGSDAKFEVVTDRAVAGVRGTVFRVDAFKPARAAPKAVPNTRVRVQEGAVNVKPLRPPGWKGAKKGQRTEVPGPHEVGVDEWEKKFKELQLEANQELTLGDDLYEPKAYEGEKDAFDDFVEKHR